MTVSDPVVLNSISVKSGPSKTSYTTGDTLNTSGLVLNLHYSDGSTKTADSGFTCSPTSLSKAGSQTITVTYSGKTTSFTVTVSDPVVLSSISVKSGPSKTGYQVGDTLNTAGLVLNLKYSDGSTKTADSGFTCSPTALNTEGSQTITVTYSGKTTSFTVTVSKITLSSVSVKSGPSKTSYVAGDKLDTAGLVLTATYSDGHTENVSSGFTCSPTDLNTAGSQTHRQLQRQDSQLFGSGGSSFRDGAEHRFGRFADGILRGRYAEHRGPEPEGCLQ